jgi:hypothetical protein
LAPVGFRSPVCHFDAPREREGKETLVTGKFFPEYPATPEEEAEIQRLIESDQNAPEATDEALENAPLFQEVFPDLAESWLGKSEQRG